MTPSKYSIIGLVSSVAFIVLLTGCVGYVDGPRRHREVYVAPAPVYVAPAPVYVAPAVVVEDSYVYYPGYQVYYNSYRHDYHYREGNVWVSRSAPPHVSAEMVFASPSVRMDFHDSPANHHAAVAKQYPKHWTPPAHGHEEPHGHEDRH